MGTPCRFMFDNIWDNGTVTASSENSAFPATNTQHQWPTRGWRSTSILGTEWLKCQLDDDSDDIDVIIVWNHNLTDAGAITVEGNNADVWTSPAFSATVNICGDYAIVFLPSTKNYAFWRITFLDTTIGDGYHFVGRVFIGSYLEPVRSYRRGASFPRLDPSPYHFSEGHQLSSVKRDKYNQYQYTFENTYEKDDFDEVFDAVGNIDAIFFCETPDSPCGATLYVRIAEWNWSPGVMVYWNLALTLEDYL